MHEKKEVAQQGGGMLPPVRVRVRVGVRVRARVRVRVRKGESLKNFAAGAGACHDSTRDH